MKVKPLILLVSLILTSFLLVGITLSEFPPESPRMYSPWGDLNNDGLIDIFDIVWLAKRYDTTGTPVNKTALLYNVNDTYSELLIQIDQLNDTVKLLRSFLDGNMSNITQEIQSMNESIAGLQDGWNIFNSTRIGKMLWDSDWRSLAIGPNTFIFDTPLSTYNRTLVYMVGRETQTGPLHQIDYGGYAHGVEHHGAYWYDLTHDSISVNRHGNDANWYYVRIIIWETLP